MCGPWSPIPLSAPPPNFWGLQGPSPPPPPPVRSSPAQPLFGDGSTGPHTLRQRFRHLAQNVARSPRGVYRGGGGGLCNVLKALPLQQRLAHGIAYVRCNWSCNPRRSDPAVATERNTSHLVSCGSQEGTRMAKLVGSPRSLPTGYPMLSNVPGEYTPHCTALQHEARCP